MEFIGKYERGPLHFACIWNHLPIFQYLIENGCNIELEVKKEHHYIMHAVLALSLLFNI